MIIVIMKNTTIDPVFKTISYSCLLVCINPCYPLLSTYETAYNQ